jgi:flagellar M-ring protein FliF
LAKEQAKLEADDEGVSYHKDGSSTDTPVLEGPKSSELPKNIEELMLVDTPPDYEKRLEYLQRIVDHDPKLIAQVVKRWIK